MRVDTAVDLLIHPRTLKDKRPLPLHVEVDEKTGQHWIPLRRKRVSVVRVGHELVKRGYRLVLDSDGVYGAERLRRSS